MAPILCGSGASSSSFLTSSLSSLFMSSSSDSSNRRALGAAATLGLSMVIMSVVGQHKNNNKDHQSSKLEMLQEILQQLVATIKGDPNSPQATTKRVVHKGSCHCEAIHFEFLAPQTLIANESPIGKIRYPHVRVSASRLRISKGTEKLQMYYVSNKNTTTHSSMAAHSFCCQCGVHILHAPSPDSMELDVNVDLLQTENIKVTREQDNLSTGVCMEDQWEMHDGASFWGRVDEGFWSKFEDDKSTSLPSTVSETLFTSSSTRRSSMMMMEQESTLSEDSSDLLSTHSLSKPPAGLPTMIESPSSSSATPMMRDQLKYYMSKYSSKTVDKLNTTTNKAVEGKTPIPEESPASTAEETRDDEIVHRAEQKSDDLWDFDV